MPPPPKTTYYLLQCPSGGCYWNSLATSASGMTSLSR
jgi:hypothetical protein